MGSSEEAGSPEEAGSAAVDGPVEGVGSIVGAESPNGVGSLRLGGSWTLQVLQCVPEIELIQINIIILNQLRTVRTSLLP